MNSILWWLAPLVNASRLSLSLLIDHASDLRPDKSARKEAYTPARTEARPTGTTPLSSASTKCCAAITRNRTHSSRGALCLDRFPELL